MSNEMMLVGGDQLPDYLRNSSTGVGGQLMESIGTLRNRIGLKGNRFRVVVAGQEAAVRDENYLDVVLVGAAPAVSRVFYGSSYNPDEKSRPDCYSADNRTPARDVVAPQSASCATCPQNVKGSRVTDRGEKTRACSFFRRLAVWVVGDESGTIFQLDAKAMSLFATDGKDGKFSLNEYARWLQARGIDVGVVVTRLSFDTESSVPKLYFAPSRYLSQEEHEFVLSVVGSQEVQDVLKVDISTVDHTAEETPPAEEAEPEIAPAPTSAPAPAPRAAAPKAPAPAAKPAPAPAPAPAPKAPAPAPRPAAPAPAPAPRAPAPKAPAAAAKPALAAVRSAPMTPPPAAAPQPAPATAAELSDLSDLLGDLGSVEALET